MSTLSRPCSDAIVFIDLENVGYGFVNTYKYPLDWERLLDMIQRTHRPKTIIAFAKFHNTPRYVISGALKRFLRNKGVVIREVPENKYGKNLSDLMIINSLWETAIDQQGKINQIILASGDGDFSATLQSIKNRFHYQITVYALRDCLSPELLAASDNTHLLDCLYDDPKDSTLEEFLTQAVTKTMRQPSDRWFTFSSLRAYAQERRPETILSIEDAMKNLLKGKAFITSYKFDHRSRPIPRIRLNTAS